MTGEPQPGFWSRLSKAFRWLFQTILRLAIIILIVVGLVATVVFMVDQINRVTRLNNRLNLVDSELKLLAGREETQRELVSELQATMTTQASRLAAVENSLDSELVSQGDLLNVLEAEVNDLLASGEIISQSVTTLAAGLVALQNDVNDNGAQIDALGGEVDSWQADVATMQIGLADLTAASQEPDDEFVRLQRSVTLFYIWELIARARLRLIESNLGLATSDIEQAALALESLAGIASQGEAEALLPVQARLTLALESLPADPVAAARDLDAAWEEVDGLMRRLLQSESGLLEAGVAVTPAAVGTPTSEGAGTPEATATPEGGTTPEPTPNPTAGS